MQSESSTKKHILSELVAAKNIIKNKFRKAYTDRIKRERVIREIMKPVLSTANEYEKTVKNTSIENKNTTVKSAKLKPFVTPKLGRISRKSVKKGDRRLLRKANSNSDDDDDDGDVDKKISQKSPSYHMMALARETSKKYKEKTPTSTLSTNAAPSVKDQWRASRRSTRIESANKERGLRNDDNEEESAWASPISSQNRSRSEGRQASSRGVVLTRNERKQLEKGGGGISGKSNSIDFNFIPYDVNNRIIYEYFDDPNELCERLRLLVSSRMAGNTNHMQEMNSIIEELRELNYIE